MENLNDFEISILNRISLKYPNIKYHIPLLKVINREITGVGMYINFIYFKPINDIATLEILNGSVSLNERIRIDGLEFGLGYEINISGKMIKFIELITFGEEWDGNYKGFNFINQK